MTFVVGNNGSALKIERNDTSASQISKIILGSDTSDANAISVIEGNQTIWIDPAPAAGDAGGTVVIKGNLQVDGTTTTLNSTTLDIDDLNITLAKGAADSAAADGAGITIDGASKTFTWSHANQYFTANSKIESDGFVISGQSGFLKADGTVDSTSYLSSFSESDTLATVTTRGNSTTLDINVAGVELNSVNGIVGAAQHIPTNIKGFGDVATNSLDGGNVNISGGDSNAASGGSVIISTGVGDGSTTGTVEIQAAYTGSPQTLSTKARFSHLGTEFFEGVRVESSLVLGTASTNGIIKFGTSGGHSTKLSFNNPTATRTITFPNASGTVALLGDPATFTVADASTSTQGNLNLDLTYSSGQLSITGNAHGLSTSSSPTFINLTLSNGFIYASQAATNTDGKNLTLRASNKNGTASNGGDVTLYGGQGSIYNGGIFYLYGGTSSPTTSGFGLYGGYPTSGQVDKAGPTSIIGPGQGTGAGAGSRLEVNVSVPRESGSSYQSMLTAMEIDHASVLLRTDLKFEGSTNDANETTLTVTDPTADRTITFPDASGTVALTSDLTGFLTAESDTLQTVTDRGATTTNVITVGGLVADGTSDHVITGSTGGAGGLLTLVASSGGLAGTNSTVYISGTRYGSGNGEVYINGNNGSTGTGAVYINYGGNNGESAGTTYIGNTGGLYTNDVYINNIKYPNADGTAGQVLVTDGAGGLSFSTITETDTLASVTGRGATTTNAITVGGITTSGAIRGVDNVSGSERNITIKAGGYSAAGDGGMTYIYGGDSTGSFGNGGDVIIAGGAPTGGSGGDVGIYGAASSSGRGGNITLGGGNSSTSNGGNIEINAGRTTAFSGTFGGNVLISAGSTPSTSGNQAGYVSISAGYNQNVGSNQDAVRFIVYGPTGAFNQAVIIKNTGLLEANNGISVSSEGIVYVGSTNTTSLVAADPSANQTITLPNASGTVALLSDITTVAESDTLDTVTTRGNTTTNTINVGEVNVSGLMTATQKSFTIDHPTKEGYKLRYGSLEGPENGIYVRGRLQGSNVIELPDYWPELIHEDSITVQLTANGRFQKLYVKDIKDNKVIVGNGSWFSNNTDCFYVVYGERKDVDKLTVEFEV